MGATYPQKPTAQKMSQKKSVTKSVTFSITNKRYNKCHTFATAFHFPPLIRCDCIIIARLVILQLPSVIPACRRLFLVIPTSSSLSVSKIVEIDPK